MPYNPALALDIKVEVQINGTWMTVTSRARKAGGLRTKHGRSDGAIQGETSRCQITIGNDDGYLTEGNPMSPWYPYVGRGTPIRVSLQGILSTDAVRFEGEIDEIEAFFPDSTHCSVFVTATGTLGVLAQSNDPLRSPLFRTLSGVTPGDFVPHSYWPMEDGTGATQIASGLADGQGAAFTGAFTFAADSSNVGSAPLPTLATGAVLSFPVASYTDQGQWVVQLAVKMPSEPAATTTILEATATGGDPALWKLTVEPGAPGLIRWANTKADGAAGPGAIILTFNEDPPFTPGEASFYGHWFLITVAAHQNGANCYGWMSLNDGDRFTGLMQGGGSPGTHSRLTGLRSAIDANASGIAIGHATVYVDPAFSITGTSARVNGRAMDGHAGEEAHDRIERLCTEEGIPVVISGTSSAVMGPQPLATLPEILRDCERADQGLLGDSGTAGAITYRTLGDLYNQLPQIAVTKGALSKDFKPLWDNQRTRNDITVTRAGGSSARASDEDHVTRTRRRIKDSPTINVDSDDVLADHAGFHLSIGTAPGPRYATGGINLRNEHGAALAAAVVGLTAGDRFTATAAALPSQHPPGGFDQMVIGWDEYLDAYEWLVYPNLVPYSPYVTAIWDTEGSVLHTALTDTAISADVATTSGPLWTTDVGPGFDWGIGGEQVRVTAIANTNPTFGTAGTASHAVNANVTPGLPASTAAGDLLLVFAAIRNSGAGVPSTPAGYTRLPVFEAVSNVQLFGKIAGAGETAPTISFTGGVAGADTSAQMIRIVGLWHDVNNIIVAKASCLNASAQNITYPGLSDPPDDAIFFRLNLGWKQDDWTSVTSPGGEIGEPSTITGDDQGLVWSYNLVTGTDPSGVFTVTGGASAISRGAVVALRCDRQTATIVRSVNGVVKAHAASTDVSLWQPSRWAL